MGLNASKTRRNVTKVAPMPNREEGPPGCVAVYTFHSPLRETGPNSFASRMGRKPVLERHLPPLRETQHGRYPTEPRTVPPDLTTPGGETSIIKQHPPRRLQKLEPFILAKDVLPDKYWSLQGTREGRTGCNTPQSKAAVFASDEDAGNTKRVKSHLSMQAELKRRLQEEARFNQPQTRDLNIPRTLGCLQGDHGSDDEDLLGVAEDHQALNRNHADLRSRGHFKEHEPFESHLGQQGKVEAWLLSQQSRRESSSDESSTDSDIWEYPRRKPALVRTKTERITLFDGFFDQEL
uniref:Factor associated with metabolism and energy isoform X2 n=1 Tax=Pogona vitticeps TaxID=103695 RepID=A0ABM5FC24_9SAUR